MANGQQSFTMDLRDTFFNAVARMPFFATYTKRKNKMEQVQPDLLPYLGVYLIPEETMTPDGDANAGNVRFIHTFRIGFSVMILNNDRDVAEHTIDAAFWAIMTGLWTDPYLNNVRNTFNPATQIGNLNNVMFERIDRGARRHAFGNANATNETPLAELQYDVTIVYRSWWEPNMFDDLLLVDIKTQVELGDPLAEVNARVQAEVQIEFDQQKRAYQEVLSKRRDGNG
jgi:hypothetical protein